MVRCGPVSAMVWQAGVNTPLTHWVIRLQSDRPGITGEAFVVLPIGGISLAQKKLFEQIVVKFHGTVVEVPRRARAAAATATTAALTAVTVVLIGDTADEAEAATTLALPALPTAARVMHSSDFIAISSGVTTAAADSVASRKRARSPSASVDKGSALVDAGAAAPTVTATAAATPATAAVAAGGVGGRASFVLGVATCDGTIRDHCEMLGIDFSSCVGYYEVLKVCGAARALA